MTLKEAYKILGVSKENSDREIKAKYKKLLIMYHPDSDPLGKRDPADDDRIRQVIEAYKKIRESDGETCYDTYEFTWDAFINNGAFAERNIYFQFKMYDEALPLSKMSRGKYVWDPDMEEFPLFTKSVLEACKEVMADHDVPATPDKVKDIFHLMMQEYVLPADAARKLGKILRDEDGKEVYAFNGFIKDPSECSAEVLEVFLRGDRAVAVEFVSGKTVGAISFDEDELYYVVLPLLEDPSIDTCARVTKSGSNRRGKERLHIRIELAIPKDLVDTPVVNGLILSKMILGK